MIRNREIFKIAFRNLSRHKSRTLFCILAIALATFINIQGTGIWEGMFDSWLHAAYVFDMGQLRISTQDFQKRDTSKPLQFPIAAERKSLDQLIAEIDAIPGVRKAFPRLETKATLLENEVKHVFIWGLRFGEEIKFNNFNYLEKSNGVKMGRFPAPNENECMVGNELAIKLKIKIGDHIPMKFISGENSDKYINPEVVGIFDFDFVLYNNDYIVLDFNTMQKTAGLEEKTQTICVFTEKSWIDDSRKQMKLKTQIQNLFANSQIIVESWKTADSNILTDVRVFKSIITVLYLIFTVLAGFLILNTISMIIIERYKEIGLLSSLGMTQKTILFSFFIEGLYLGLIGTMAGMIIGGTEIFILSGFPIDVALLFGKGELPYSATFYLKFAYSIVFSNGIQAFIITILSSVIPAMRVLRINPMDAMRK